MGDSSEGNFAFFASKQHEISPKNTCIERKKLSSIRLNHPQPVALPSKRATDQSSMAEQTPKRPKRGKTTPSSTNGTHYARVNVDDAIYERIRSDFAHDTSPWPTKPAFFSCMDTYAKTKKRRLMRRAKKRRMKRINKCCCKTVTVTVKVATLVGAK